MIDYGMLVYPGNVTGSDDAQPGRLLGVNEAGMPWEVLDAEFRPSTDEEPCGPDCERTWGHTHVQLQTASVDAMRAAIARTTGTVLVDDAPRHVRRQQQRAEGSLGKKRRRR